ncbi:MAG: HAD family hydrolase [Candidatus Binatia bacterium]
MQPATHAVLFDFGGTLYDYRSLEPGDRESIAILAQELGIEASEEEIRAAHRRGVRKAFERYLPEPYYLHRDFFLAGVAEMAKTFGVDVSLEQFTAYRERQWGLQKRDFVLRPGVPETLKQLRNRGLRLGIVSNIDRDQLDYMMGLAGIAGRFDWLLSSEEAGSCKPDQRIFEQALELAECAPGEALFVGDSIDQDIAGARRTGIRSALLWYREDREPPAERHRPDHVIRKIPDVLGLV